MKRILLAGLAVCALVLARERVCADQENAYDSLLGMAASAAVDKGPAIEKVPESAEPVRRIPVQDPSSDQPAWSWPATVSAAEFRSRGATATSVRKRNAGPDFEPVSVPRAIAPRIWTRLFTSLLPSPEPAPRIPFEVEASSTAPRAPLVVRESRATLEAHESGSAMGLRELVAAATAPSR